MTVRVTQKMRKRIDVMKYFKKTKKEKELVTDGSYKEIRTPRAEKQKWIYTTPDDGKTIYREPLSYCDVSGVKIDEGEQLEFNFNNIEDDINEWVEKMEDKISQVATLIGEITEEVKKLRDNN